MKVRGFGFMVINVTFNNTDTPASSTTKIGRHDIAEILLKVV
jgi:hypothetical protein